MLLSKMINRGGVTSAGRYKKAIETFSTEKQEEFTSETLKYYCRIFLLSCIDQMQLRRFKRSK